MDEDAIDIELRAPSEVAGRCIVLAALLRRLSLESLDTNTHAEERSTDAFDILLWLRSEGFGDTLTSSELDHLSRPVGDLREEENRAFVEPAEGLTTLGWALNLGDSLAFHQTAEVATLISSIPSPWEDTSSWLRAAQLRAEDEIARERERTEVTSWRIRIEPERRAAVGTERAELEEIITQVEREVEVAGLTDSPYHDESAHHESPVQALDEETLELRSALAEERLRALNWVCGFGESWDRVPLAV